MLEPIWICVVSIAKYLSPPPRPTSGALMFLQLVDDRQQNIPQLDDYRRYPPALDKYAFFLLQSLSVEIFNRNQLNRKYKRSYSEIIPSSLATFVVFCRTFVQHGNNGPCVSIILRKQTSKSFEQTIQLNVPRRLFKIAKKSILHEIHLTICS